MGESKVLYIFNFNSELTQFVVKSVPFAVLPFVLFFSAWFLGNGYTDAFYLRFTSPTQNSLILGNSKAAQGILPHIINDSLSSSFYNYSFTNAQSPFGSVYLKSIIKKHDENSMGKFIISVDPWSIGSLTSIPNDTSNFRENNLALARTTNVSSKPNWGYIKNNLKGNFVNLVIPPNQNLFLHDDGWLEVKNIPMDSRSISSRTKSKVKAYSNLIETYSMSHQRLRYLEETVEYLCQFGEVYLVRLPVSKEIFEIEQKVLVEFNEVIKSVTESSSGYIDLSKFNQEFLYTDGIHLHKSSGEVVTRLIMDYFSN